jgi:hypothetical protein
MAGELDPKPGTFLRPPIGPQIEAVEPTWSACTTCGSRVTYTLELAGRGYCGDCIVPARAAEQRRIEGEQILVDLAGRTELLLEAMGISARDRRARLADVPASVRPAIPQGWGSTGQIRARIAGWDPIPGFGIAALAGAGKTSLFSSLVREITSERVRARAPKLGRAVLEPWAIWLSWPEAVNRLRLMSLGDGGLEAAHEVVKRASSAELLILDDLGAERIRGAAADDWAASQLDLIVDARDGAMLPTWYSSTILDRALAERYGQRLFSRLVGRNPLRAVKGAPDQRLVGDR